MADLNIDLLFPPITNYLDGTVILPLIQCAELSLFLPVIERTDENDNHNGDDDGETFHKVDTGMFTEALWCVATGFGRVLYADVLVDAKCQGNNSGDTEKNLGKLSKAG